MHARTNGGVGKGHTSSLPLSSPLSTPVIDTSGAASESLTRFLTMMCTFVELVLVWFKVAKV